MNQLVSANQSAWRSLQRRSTQIWTANRHTPSGFMRQPGLSSQSEHSRYRQGRTDVLGRKTRSDEQRRQRDANLRDQHKSLKRLRKDIAAKEQQKKKGR
jgi:hypothetical protein